MIAPRLIFVTLGIPQPPFSSVRLRSLSTPLFFASYGVGIYIQIDCEIMNAACVLAIGALWIRSASAQPRKMVQADDSSNGRQVELQVGETLEIGLSENASTGFRWNAPLELAHKLEKILRQGETSAEGSSAPIGKPGVRHFYFEAIGPGMVELELHYSRPWEAGKKPGRKYKLRVLVRRAPEH